MYGLQPSGERIHTPSPPLLSLFKSSLPTVTYSTLNSKHLVPGSRSHSPSCFSRYSHSISGDSKRSNSNSEDHRMSSTSRAWIVAASVGAVEALKDQGGFCRWNYAIRSLHQHAKNNLGSLSQANRLPSSSSSSSSSMAMAKKLVPSDEKVKQSEESLRKVMYLSCWGPN